MKKIILILLLSVNANAVDLSLVQPMDDKIAKELKWEEEEYSDTISDWTLYAMITWPIIETFKEKHTWKRLATLASAHYMSSSVTHFVKQRANRVRPNGKGTQSFFSGHTSAAFTGAAFLCATESESKCYLGLGLATATGYLRIAANKHWLTDVLVGAIVGYSFGYAVPVYIFSF